MLRKGFLHPSSFRDRFPDLTLMVALLAILANPGTLLAADEPRSRSFNAKGVRIHFLVEGNRDPVKRMYVVPLRQVRKDLPVVEIKDAGHINCIIKKQFREEVVASVRRQNKT